MRQSAVADCGDPKGPQLRASLILVMAAVLSLGTSAPAQTRATMPQPNTTYPTGQNAKIKGVIISRKGEDFLVQHDEDKNLISWVSLTNDTQLSSPTGFLRLDRKSQDAQALQPGLLLTVWGAGGQHGNLEAHRISFRKSALKVTTQINAGEVEPAARQQATADSLNLATARARRVRDSLDAALTAIDRRVASLDTYDVKDSAVVNFKINSAVLDDAAKSTLRNIVSRGQGTKGVLVEVAGFADITGTAERNQVLSRERADAVVAYLTEVSAVPVRRVAGSVGLGTSRPVASNETAEGRAQNRRVVVRVLVNRGLSRP